MSAIQVIEFYSSLPQEEQRIVADHVIKDDIPCLLKAAPSTDFKSIVHQVFDKHSQLMERLAQ